MEADEVKERVKEFPQTYLAFTGSSGKSVKIWVRFTYPWRLFCRATVSKRNFSMRTLTGSP